MKKIISVALPKGGVTKTTTVINLASRLSKSHSVSVIDLDRSRQVSKFNSIFNNLNVLACNTSEHLKDLLYSCHDDFIILDLGGFDSELQRWALYWSDIILIPVTDSDSDLIELSSFVDTIQSSIFTNNNDYTKCLILPSRIHHFSTKLHVDLKKQFDKVDRFKVLDCRISQLSVYTRMMGSGKSVFQMDSQRAINDNIDLAESIIKECNNG